MKIIVAFVCILVAFCVDAKSENFPANCLCQDECVGAYKEDLCFVGCLMECLVDSMAQIFDS